MEYLTIREQDYHEFHRLANAYYREGEDENTPQEVIDSFIRLMFDKVMRRKYRVLLTRRYNYQNTPV
jgi:hypothetical protein